MSLSSPNSLEPPLVREDSRPELDRLRQRIEELEHENSRLRARAHPVGPVHAKNPVDSDHYRLVFEKAQEIIVLIQDNRIVLSNPRAQAISGYSSDELTGIAPIDLIHPHDRGRVEEALKSLEMGRDVSSEVLFRGVTRDEKIVWLEGVGASVAWNGAPAGLIYANDVTSRFEAEEARRQSEEKYKFLFDNVGIGILVTLKGGVIRMANRAAGEITGLSAEKLIGRKMDDFVHPEDGPRILDMMLRARAGEPYDKNFEYRLITPDGQERWVASSTIFVQWDGELAALKFITDVTDRVEAQQTLERTLSDLDQRVRERTWELEEVNERLAKSETMFKTLTKTLAAGITIQQNERMVFANETALTMFGLNPLLESDQYSTMSMFDFVHPDMRELAKGRRDARIQGDKVIDRFDLKLMSNDGLTKWVDLAVQRVQYDGLPATMATFLDATARRETEGKLEANRAKLQALAGELAVAEEKERRRIAIDLHDRVSQTLGMCLSRLRGMRSEIPPGDTRDRFDHIVDHLKKTVQDIRSLTFELSPPILYELGLEPALEWLIENFRIHYGLNVKFYDDFRAKPLDERLKILLFQAARELLINVSKHSRATQAELRIFTQDEFVRISVEDGGIGVDPEQAARPSQQGFGLFSIRERLEPLGGAIDIRSEKDRGTLVVLTAPKKTMD